MSDKTIKVPEEADATDGLVIAALHLAVLTYVTQGGVRSYKGLFAKLIEAGFGTFKKIDGVFWTAVDEPFELIAIDNCYQATRQTYLQLRQTVLKTSSVEQAQGSLLGEFSLPNEMVHLFHGKKISRSLMRTHHKVPQEMTDCRASIVGWSEGQGAMCDGGTSLANFLDAHMNKNSRLAESPLSPFLSLAGLESNPSLVFVVRFDKPGSTSLDAAAPIICPVLVQTRLVEEPDCEERDEAYRAIHRTIRQSCGQHGHYIHLPVDLVAIPSAKGSYCVKKDLASEEHDDKTLITLVVDTDNIFDVFRAQYNMALAILKMAAKAVTETQKEVQELEDLKKKASGGNGL
ncbi:hypothetical protein EMPS_08015 [Entomortierella parvispora]|uniref:Uncharacterized protein n=1 Tax=Entomortierella parvispora TaxID=205924 RepID=A0A9P3HFF9_9FUNG|nr:hypothetical protein EMPS_08015 [Entomortierella parvispora]